LAMFSEGKCSKYVVYKSHKLFELPPAAYECLICRNRS